MLTWKAVSWLPSPYHTKVCTILCGLFVAVLSLCLDLSPSKLIRYLILRPLSRQRRWIVVYWFLKLFIREIKHRVDGKLQTWDSSLRASSPNGELARRLPSLIRPSFPRRGRQARNFTTNVLKILHLKSSSEQIFLENWHWVPLISGTLCLKNVLLFLNGFGIHLNGSGYLFQKNCHPFACLGLSVWKKMSSFWTAWAIRSKKKINVIRLNSLGCPFGKNCHLFQRLGVSVSKNCYPFGR